MQTVIARDGMEGLLNCICFHLGRLMDNCNLDGQWEAWNGRENEWGGKRVDAGP